MTQYDKRGHPCLGVSTLYDIDSDTGEGLLVEVSLDALLGGLLKLLLLQLYGREAAVGRRGGIESLAVLLHEVLQLGGAQSHGLGLFVVGVDKGHELVAPLHHHALCHHGERGELVLKLLGIDVLAVGAEEHVLDAATDEDVALGIHGAKVAGVVPSVGIEDGGGGFRILVVAEHDVWAPGHYLAGYGGGVVAEDAHLLVDGGTAAAAGHEALVVCIADDGGALGGAVAHGVAEAYLVEEGLYLLAEGGAADDDLIEAASEGCCNLLADLLVHLLADDGHAEEQPHLVVLYLGEDALADDLLNDQGHGDDDARAYVGKCLGDDSRAGHAGEVIDVAAGEKLEDELEGHAVHVGHGEDADDGVTGMDLGSEDVAGEVGIAPHGAVGQHHALGVAGGAAGIVDEGKLVGALLAIVGHMLASEVLGVLAAEHLVEVLSGIGETVGAREHKRVVGDVDDALEGGHAGAVYLGGHHVADEEELGLAVVDDVVDLVGGELVQDGHGHGTVGDGGEKGACPRRTVAAAEGYLVALGHAAALEEDVELLYLAGHVVILQGGSFVVGECIEVPMVFDALLDERVETGNFHTVRLKD